MLVNNYEIETENIKYLGHSVINPNIISNYYDNGNSFPVYYDTDIGMQELTIKILITADTIETVNSLISNTIYTLKGVSNIQFNDDDFSYKAIYSKHSMETLSPLNCKLTFIMKAQRESTNYKSIICSGDTDYSFNIGGTKKTEPIITIILPVSITEFRYISDKGITISNISNSDEEAVTNTIVINSEDKTIKLNDVNCFINCDIVDFPMLEIGENLLTVSSNLAQISILYKEKYI